MQLGRGFRRLATIVDDLEKQDVDVVEATVADDDETTDGTLQVDLRLSVPVASEKAETSDVAGGEAAAEATEQQAATGTRQSDRTSGPTEQGAETVERRQKSPATTQASNGQAAEQTSEDSAESEAVIECPFPDCDATFDSEPGMKIHRTKVHLSNGETTDHADADTPAYRDPEILEAVYAEHDTFPAMREALDADVSTQTIRRHMIKHGIHDPAETTADDSPEAETADDETTGTDETTAGAVDGETEPGPEDSDESGETDAQLLTDGSSLADALPAGVDCPEDVTLEQLRESVEDADTLYDIQQEFELDREMARDLLAALDLLELVHGRVATRHHREELKAEIDRRIRESIDASA